MHAVSDRTPVIVGAGQYVERAAGATSPMEIASTAARIAIAESAGRGVAATIDTIAVVKIFSDSTKLWANAFGRSNNPPQSIAARIGATPSHRVYTEVGGNEPQTLLIEFFADLAPGREE